MSRATRNPMKVLRVFSGTNIRSAERIKAGVPLQEPPRAGCTLQPLSLQALPSAGAPAKVACQQSATACITFPFMSKSPHGLAAKEPTGAGFIQVSAACAQPAQH